MRNVMLLAHEEGHIIICTSTIGFRSLQYDSFIHEHMKETAWFLALASVFPRQRPAMIDEVSRHVPARPWSSRLRELGDGAERLVFSSGDRHWTNSFMLWISLNVVDAAITWQCLSIGGYEANPFLRLAALTHGDGLMLVGKLVLALLIGALVWRRGTRRLKGFLNLGMTLVLIANCVLICKWLWSLNLS